MERKEGIVLFHESRQQRIGVYTGILYAVTWCSLAFARRFLVWLAALGHIAFDEGNTALTNALVYALLLLLTVCTFGGVWRESRRNLPADGAKRIVKKLGWSLLILVAVTFASGLLNIAAESFFAVESANDARAETVMTSGGLVLWAILSVIVGPFVEETLYRYGIFRFFYDKSPTAAYLISSILFGLGHVLNPEMMHGNFSQFILLPAYAIMGTGLAWIYDRTNNLHYPLLMHALRNLAGVIIQLIYFT